MLQLPGAKLVKHKVSLGTMLKIGLPVLPISIRSWMGTLVLLTTPIKTPLLLKPLLVRVEPLLGKLTATLKLPPVCVTVRTSLQSVIVLLTPLPPVIAEQVLAAAGCALRMPSAGSASRAQVASASARRREKTSMNASFGPKSILLD